MTDASYVIGGWILTGVVLGGYGWRLAAKTRQARKALPPDDRQPWK